MQLRLHANATTTPRTRAYIQQSAASDTALARELGIHPRTVARWKARQDVADRSTRPHRLATTITEWEEALILELRRSLTLPLDDIVEAMRRCVNPQLSRSGVHRCLQRHGLSARLTPQTAPAASFQTDRPVGFIHIDVKYLPPLNRQRRYAYVAIDRATRFVYLEILCDRRGETAAGFLARFLDGFPLPVHTILTDNGSEFTDRFAVDKKGKPNGRPSASTRSTAPAPVTPSPIASPSPSGRRPTAWSNASTAASASISPQSRKTAPPTTAAFTTMPNATPTCTALSPTIIAPGCDALTIRHPPSSSLNSRDTTRRPGAPLAMASRSWEKTLAQLSVEFGVHPTMISNWKQELMTRAGELFARGNRAPADRRR